MSKRNSIAVVEVVVEGRSYKIERELLTKHSPFFKRTLEKDENKRKNKLKLSGVTAETFETLLRYMQTGEMDIKQSNVADVFNAAFRLHMSEVVKRCIQMETEATPVGQQILMYAAARRLSLHDEEKRAFSFLTAHFAAVATTKEFLEMDLEDIVQLISSDNITCHCEMEVFEACMRWLEYSPENREQLIEAVLSLIRFSNMDLSQLHQCLEHSLVAAHPIAKRILMDAILVWLNAEKEKKPLVRRERNYTTDEKGGADRSCSDIVACVSQEGRKQADKTENIDSNKPEEQTIKRRVFEKKTEDDIRRVGRLKSPSRRECGSELTATLNSQQKQQMFRSAHGAMSLPGPSRVYSDEERVSAEVFESRKSEVKHSKTYVDNVPERLTEYSSEISRGASDFSIRSIGEIPSLDKVTSAPFGAVEISPSVGEMPPRHEFSALTTSPDTQKMASRLPVRVDSGEAISSYLQTPTNYDQRTVDGDHLRGELESEEDVVLDGDSQPYPTSVSHDIQDQVSSEVLKKISATKLTFQPESSAAVDTYDALDSSALLGLPSSGPVKASSNRLSEAFPSSTSFQDRTVSEPDSVLQPVDAPKTPIANTLEHHGIKGTIEKSADKPSYIDTCPPRNSSSLRNLGSSSQEETDLQTFLSVENGSMGKDRQSALDLHVPTDGAAQRGYKTSCIPMDSLAELLQKTAVVSVDNASEIGHKTSNVLVEGAAECTRKTSDVVVEGAVTSVRKTSDVFVLGAYESGRKTSNVLEGGVFELEHKAARANVESGKMADEFVSHTKSKENLPANIVVDQNAVSDLNLRPSTGADTTETKHETTSDNFVSFTRTGSLRNLATPHSFTQGNIGTVHGENEHSQELSYITTFEASSKVFREISQKDTTEQRPLEHLKLNEGVALTSGEKKEVVSQSTIGLVCETDINASPNIRDAVRASDAGVVISVTDNQGVLSNEIDTSENFSVEVTQIIASIPSHSVQIIEQELVQYSQANHLEPLCGEFNSADKIVASLEQVSGAARSTTSRNVFDFNVESSQTSLTDFKMMGDSDGSSSFPTDDQEFILKIPKEQLEKCHKMLHEKIEDYSRKLSAASSQSSQRSLRYKIQKLQTRQQCLLKRMLTEKAFCESPLQDKKQIIPSEINQVVYVAFTPVKPEKSAEKSNASSGASSNVQASSSMQKNSSNPQIIKRTVTSENKIICTEKTEEICRKLDKDGKEIQDCHVETTVKEEIEVKKEEELFGGVDENAKSPSGSNSSFPSKSVSYEKKTITRTQAKTYPVSGTDAVPAPAPVAGKAGSFIDVSASSLANQMYGPNLIQTRKPDEPSASQKPEQVPTIKTDVPITKPDSSSSDAKTILRSQKKPKPSTDVESKKLLFTGVPDKDPVLKSDGPEDETEPALPTNKFSKKNRKDSIAVTKMRMINKELGKEEEEDDDDEDDKDPCRKDKSDKKGPDDAKDGGSGGALIGGHHKDIRFTTPNSNSPKQAPPKPPPGGTQHSIQGALPGEGEISKPRPPPPPPPPPDNKFGQKVPESNEEAAKTTAKVISQKDDVLNELKAKLTQKANNQESAQPSVPPAKAPVKVPPPVAPKPAKAVKVADAGKATASTADPVKTVEPDATNLWSDLSKIRDQHKSGSAGSTSLKEPVAKEVHNKEGPSKPASKSEEKITSTFAKNKENSLTKKTSKENKPAEKHLKKSDGQLAEREASPLSALKNSSTLTSRSSPLSVSGTAQSDEVLKDIWSKVSSYKIAGKAVSPTASTKTAAVSASPSLVAIWSKVSGYKATNLDHAGKSNNKIPSSKSTVSQSDEQGQSGVNDASLKQIWSKVSGYKIPYVASPSAKYPPRDTVNKSKSLENIWSNVSSYNIAEKAFKKKLSLAKSKSFDESTLATIATVTNNKTAKSSSKDEFHSFAPTETAVSNDVQKNRLLCTSGSTLNDVSFSADSDSALSSAKSDTLPNKDAQGQAAGPSNRNNSIVGAQLAKYELARLKQVGGGSGSEDPDALLQSLIKELNDHPDSSESFRRASLHSRVDIDDELEPTSSGVAVGDLHGFIPMGSAVKGPKSNQDPGSQGSSKVDSNAELLKESSLRAPHPSMTAGFPQRASRSSTHSVFHNIQFTRKTSVSQALGMQVIGDSASDFTSLKSFGSTTNAKSIILVETKLQMHGKGRVVLTIDAVNDKSSTEQLTVNPPAKDFAKSEDDMMHRKGMSNTLNRRLSAPEMTLSDVPSLTAPSGFIGSQKGTGLSNHAKLSNEKSDALAQQKPVSESAGTIRRDGSTTLKKPIQGSRGNVQFEDPKIEDSKKKIENQNEKSGFDDQSKNKTASSKEKEGDGVNKLSVKPDIPAEDDALSSEKPSGVVNAGASVKTKDTGMATNNTDAQPEASKKKSSTAQIAPDDHTKKPVLSSEEKDKPSSAIDAGASVKTKDTGMINNNTEVKPEASKKKSSTAQIAPDDYTKKPVFSSEEKDKPSSAIDAGASVKTKDTGMIKNDTEVKPEASKKKSSTAQIAPDDHTKKPVLSSEKKDVATLGKGQENVSQKLSAKDIPSLTANWKLDIVEQEVRPASSDTTTALLDSEVIKMKFSITVISDEADNSNMDKNSDSLTKGKESDVPKLTTNDIPALVADTKPSTQAVPPAILTNSSIKESNMPGHSKLDISKNKPNINHTAAYDKFGKEKEADVPTKGKDNVKNTPSSTTHRKPDVSTNEAALAPDKVAASGVKETNLPNKTQSVDEENKSKDKAKSDLPFQKSVSKPEKPFIKESGDVSKQEAKEFGSSSNKKSTDKIENKTASNDELKESKDTRKEGAKKSVSSKEKPADWDQNKILSNNDGLKEGRDMDKKESKEKAQKAESKILSNNYGPKQGRNMDKKEPKEFSSSKEKIMAKAESKILSNNDGPKEGIDMGKKETKESSSSKEKITGKAESKIFSINDGPKKGIDMGKKEPKQSSSSKDKVIDKVKSKIPSSSDRPKEGIDMGKTEPKQSSSSKDKIVDKAESKILSSNDGPREGIDRGKKEQKQSSSSKAKVTDKTESKVSSSNDGPKEGIDVGKKESKHSSIFKEKIADKTESKISSINDGPKEGIDMGKKPKQSSSSKDKVIDKAESKIPTSNDRPKEGIDKGKKEPKQSSSSKDKVIDKVESKILSSTDRPKEGIDMGKTEPKQSSSSKDKVIDKAESKIPSSKDGPKEGIDMGKKEPKQSSSSKDKVIDKADSKIPSSNDGPKEGIDMGKKEAKQSSSSKVIDKVESKILSSTDRPKEGIDMGKTEPKQYSSSKDKVIDKAESKIPSSKDGPKEGIDMGKKEPKQSSSSKDKVIDKADSKIPSSNDGPKEGIDMGKKEAKQSSSSKVIDKAESKISSSNDGPKEGIDMGKKEPKQSSSSKDKVIDKAESKIPSSNDRPKEGIDKGKKEPKQSSSSKDKVVDKAESKIFSSTDRPKGDIDMGKTEPKQSSSSKDKVIDKVESKIRSSNDGPKEGIDMGKKEPKQPSSKGKITDRAESKILTNNEPKNVNSMQPLDQKQENLSKANLRSSGSSMPVVNGKNSKILNQPDDVKNKTEQASGEKVASSAPDLSVSRSKLSVKDIPSLVFRWELEFPKSKTAINKPIAVREPSGVIKTDKTGSFDNSDNLRKLSAESHKRPLSDSTLKRADIPKNENSVLHNSASSVKKEHESSKPTKAADSNGSKESGVKKSSSEPSQLSVRNIPSLVTHWSPNIIASKSDSKQIVASKSSTKAVAEEPVKTMEKPSSKSRLLKVELKVSGSLSGKSVPSQTKTAPVNATEKPSSKACLLEVELSLKRSFLSDESIISQIKMAPIGDSSEGMRNEVQTVAAFHLVPGEKSGSKSGSKEAELSGNKKNTSEGTSGAQQSKSKPRSSFTESKRELQQKSSSRTLEPAEQSFSLAPTGSIEKNVEEIRTMRLHENPHRVYPRTDSLHLSSSAGSSSEYSDARAELPDMSSDRKKDLVVYELDVLGMIDNDIEMTVKSERQYFVRPKSCGPSETSEGLTFTLNSQVIKKSDGKIPSGELNDNPLSNVDSKKDLANKSSKPLVATSSSDLSVRNIPSLVTHWKPDIPKSDSSGTIPSKSSSQSKRDQYALDEKKKLPLTGKVQSSESLSSLSPSQATHRQKHIKDIVIPTKTESACRDIAERPSQALVGDASSKASSSAVSSKSSKKQPSESGNYSPSLATHWQQHIKDINTPESPSTKGSQKRGAGSERNKNEIVIMEGHEVFELVQPDSLTTDFLATSVADRPQSCSSGINKTPDDYLPLYLHRVTVSDKPSVAELIRSMAPHSEEWEAAVPMQWRINPAAKLEKYTDLNVQDSRGPVILVLGGINTKALGEVLAGCLMLRFSNSDRVWRRCTMMPLPRYGHKAALLGDELYIIGGFDNRDATYGLRVSSSCCFKMNIKTSEWNLLPPMKNCRGYHNVAVLGNKIYVVGGVDANDLLLSSVETYDPQQNEWKELEKGLYYGRMGMGVEAYQGRLWVAGGIIQLSGFATCSTAYVEIYDPSSSSWSYCSQFLPSPRTATSLLEFKDNLYCFGGIFYNSSGTNKKLLTIEDVLFYSDKNRWLDATPMKVARHNANLVKHGETGYLVGGQDVLHPNDPILDISEMTFQTQNISYKHLTKLPLAVSAYAVIVLPPRANS